MSHRRGHKDEKKPQSRGRSYWKSQTSLPEVDPRDQVEFEKLDWSSDGAAVQELLARGVAKATQMRNYEPTKFMLDYGFDEVDEAGKKEILKWLASTRSYSEMPPGALRYVMMLGFTPVVGGFTAAQDVVRDFVNDEVSGWTALDAASVPLEFLPLVGGLVGMVRHMDDFGEMGKLWRRVEKLRESGLAGPELQRALEAEGVDPDAARRMTGLGEESVDDFIGEFADKDEVIGAQVERRGGERGAPSAETQAEAQRMMDEMGIPAERSGAEPAHHDVIRSAARGEQDADLVRMQDIEDGKEARKQPYEDVALGKQYRAKRFQQVTPEEFHSALLKAEELNPRVKDFHSPRSLDDWKQEVENGAKLFLNELGEAGGAVLGDGDMVNAFNFGDKAHSGGVVSETLIPLLIQNGATHADWFDSRLSSLYDDYFDIVETWEYDPQFGSKVEWDEAHSRSPGALEEDGRRMADVQYGEVRPEVRRDLGLQPLNRTWEDDIAIHAGKVQDHQRTAPPIDAPPRPVTPKVDTPDAPDLPEPKTYEEAAQRAFMEGVDEFEWDGRTVNTREAEAHQYMTAEAAAAFGRTEKVYGNFMEMVRKGPLGRELASGAVAFESARDWYKNSAQALSEMFGAEAPRFTAVLAALSPRTTVPEDFKGALLFWEQYQDALDMGRTIDEDWVQSTLAAIKHPAGTSMDPPFNDAVVIASTGENNVLRALTAEDPVLEYLSGPKVNAFYNNLLQYTDKITIDTWSAKYLGLNPARLEGRTLAMADLATPEFRAFVSSEQAGDLPVEVLNARRAEEGKKPLKQGQGDRAGTISTVSPGYAAGEIPHQSAADILTQLTGRQWNGPEVQETNWSGFKTLDEWKQNEFDTMYDLWKSGRVTPEDVAAAPSFDQLAHEPGFPDLIERARGTQPTPMTRGGQSDPSIVRDKDMRELFDRFEGASRGEYRIPSMLLPVAGAGAARGAGLLSTEEDPALLRGRGLLGI
jgi:hypothetical protein